MIFSHSGNAGDILYSLHFIKEYTEAKGIAESVLHIQLNAPAKYCGPHPSGNVLMTPQTVDFIKPLLEKSGLFSSVYASETVPEGAMLLSDFRKCRINFSAGDIRSWYYSLAPEHLPQAFENKLFSLEPDRTLQGKILISITARNNNHHLDLATLDKFKEHLVFIGLPDEYENFCRKYFAIPFHPAKDALDIARLLLGSSGTICNQGGIYTIAEMLKTPRILLTPEFVRIPMATAFKNGLYSHLLNMLLSFKREVLIPGPVNNHPRGGWFEVARSDQDLNNAMQNLLLLKE